MARITPYTRAPYPTIEGNDRVYFDNEFRKIQDCIRALIENIQKPTSLGEFTIASGVATITSASPTSIAFANIDTEGAAATDDLDTITWNNGVDGQIIVFYASSGSRVPTFKDDTGNLILVGDFALAGNESITLQYFGGNFYQISSAHSA